MQSGDLHFHKIENITSNPKNLQRLDYSCLGLVLIAPQRLDLYNSFSLFLMGGEFFMWQQLVDQVGYVWIVAIVLLTLVIVVLVGLLYALIRKLSTTMAQKIISLRQDVESADGCKIENLREIQIIIGDRGGPEMKIAMEQLADDSRNLFSGLWIPDPAERFHRSMMIQQKTSWLFRQGITTLPLLASLLVSAFAFFIALSIDITSIENDIMRLLALLPLIIGGFGLVVLQQVKNKNELHLDQVWQGLIIQMKRKIPVYSQAVETAAMIKTFTQYDQQMTEATRSLSSHVEKLASSQLADAVTNAVKYVMSATIAPPIQKSADSLAVLAQQLEKKLVAGESQLVRLYTELENRQQQQADNLAKRYQEISQAIVLQQKQSLQVIITNSQQTWQELRENLNNIMQDISHSQASLQQTLLDGQTKLQQDLLLDQKQSLSVIGQESSSSLRNLSEEIVSTLHTQSMHQTSTMDDIRQNVLSAVDNMRTTAEQTMDALRLHQSETLNQLNSSQSELFGQLHNGQIEAFNRLGSNQTELFGQLSTSQATLLGLIDQHQLQATKTINEAQQIALQTLSQQQQNAFDTVSKRQLELLTQMDQRQQVAQSGFLEHQIGALQEMRTTQMDFSQQLRDFVSTSLNLIDQHQQTALTDFSKTQQNAIEHLSEQQSKGVHELLSQFSGEVADSMAAYMDPVSVRLQESAQALISAQNYANDVQQTLIMQKEQSRVLEESIRDVLEQLVTARENMSGDLSSMAESTKIMSDSASSMSAIYAGSQTGLSDAISNMSVNMLDLSESLQSILSSSAEQTKLVQAQAVESFEINERQLDAVRGQIDVLTNDLSNRIDQLMIGFSQLTSDLIENVQSTINNQNDQLGSGLKALTGVMADEARSMSLYAQQINMEIDQLNGTLGSAVKDFSEGMNLEIGNVLKQFDHETADILRRLSIAAAEIGDAIEVLPTVIQTRRTSSPDSNRPT